MKVAYDLHIHSVLSSCGDDSQRPNNILNMCMLKELEMISICDHNTAKQYETIDALKESYDFCIIYGMEITVKEGFHVLAYFENLSDIMQLDKIIDDSLNKDIVNNNDEQIICDIYDENKEIIPYVVNQPLKYTFYEICMIIKSLNGLVIPAHINRGKYGALYYYDDLSLFPIDGVEINVESLEELENLCDKYQFIKKYKYITNSDAHSIEIINDAINFIDLNELSFKGFKEWLCRG